MPKVSESHMTMRRNQILDAACACLVRNGYSATTMRDICTEASLSTGAVYNLYPHKRDILVALVARGRIRRRELLAAPARTPAELIKAILSSIHTDTAALDLSIWAAARDDEAVAVEVAQVFSELREDLEATCQARGWGNDEPAHLARILMSILLGMIVQSSLDPLFDGEELAAAIGSCSVVQKSVG